MQLQSTLLLLIATIAATAAQEDGGFEFVDEILHEEKEHYGGQQHDDPHFDDHRQQQAEETDHTHTRDYEEEEILRRQEEDEERIAREHAERVRLQREAAFEKELSRMNQEQAKQARKQKARDARIVKRILRAAQRNDHYAVLGLVYMETRIPPRSLGIGTFSLRTPGFRLLRISPKAIRKAYRQTSLKVHPDRNRDGRAEEAFIALENAAAILSDDKLRDEYDESLRASRQKRRQKMTQVVLQTMDGTLQVTRKAVAVFRRVLGPFAFPALIIGSLLV